MESAEIQEPATELKKFPVRGVKFAAEWRQNFESSGCLDPNYVSRDLSTEMNEKNAKPMLPRMFQGRPKTRVASEARWKRWLLPSKQDMPSKPTRSLATSTQSSTSLNELLNRGMERLGMNQRIQCDLSKPEKLLVLVVFVCATVAGVSALVKIRNADDEGSANGSP